MDEMLNIQVLLKGGKYRFPIDSLSPHRGYSMPWWFGSFDSSTVHWQYLSSEVSYHETLDAEMDILGTHVFNHVGETDPTVVPPGVNGVNVPMATLNWTVSPRFEAGYRSPSGFGEFDVSYRFLLTSGIGSLPAGSAASPTSAARLSSHFDMNLGDVDYASVETSLSMLGPNGPLMKWRIGLRTADLLFTSDPRPASGYPGYPATLQISLSR